MFPAFLGGMMQGLLGGGAAAGAAPSAVGGVSNIIGNIGVPAGAVGSVADGIGKIGQMPNVGGITPNNQNGQNTIGGMPQVQANPAGDPLMSKNSLLNGIGGPLMQFFGMGQ